MESINAMQMTKTTTKKKPEQFIKFSIPKGRTKIMKNAFIIHSDQCARESFVVWLLRENSGFFACEYLHGMKNDEPMFCRLRNY